MDEDLKYVITEEERSRHDALFYSTNPKKGLLSGTDSLCHTFVYDICSMFSSRLMSISYMAYSQESKQGLYLYAQDSLFQNSAKYGKGMLLQIDYILSSFIHMYT